MAFELLYSNIDNQQHINISVGRSDIYHLNELICCLSETNTPVDCLSNEKHVCQAGRFGFRIYETRKFTE